MVLPRANRGSLALLTQSPELGYISVVGATQWEVPYYSSLGRYVSMNSWVLKLAGCLPPHGCTCKESYQAAMSLPALDLMDGTAPRLWLTSFTPGAATRGPELEWYSRGGSVPTPSGEHLPSPCSVCSCGRIPASSTLASAGVLSKMPAQSV